MKKNLLAILFMTITLVSCSKMKTWDISPVNIRIYVEDTNGNNLLSPLSKNNILEDEIYVTYDNIKFPLGVDMSEEAMTRAYFAVLDGLKVYEINNEPYLIFGEFDGAKNWDDSFEIHWGDGTKDKIRFTRDFKWKINGKPKITNSNTYLNDKKVEDKLVIVK